MIDKALVINQTDDQIIDCCHHASQAFGSNAGLIFLMGDIAAVMQAIFNAPFTADNFR